MPKRTNNAGGCTHAECLSCGWVGLIDEVDCNPDRPLDEFCPKCGGADTCWLNKDEAIELGWKPKGKGPVKDPVVIDGSFTPISLSSPLVERCYHKHPALALGDFEVFGGSCISPAIKDADIYIGFDRGMTFTERSFPWTDGFELLYAIPDGQTPKNKKNFKKLVEWVADEIRDGKKAHIGCIGGHGRTGMFLAALVAVMEVDPDPIKYVRQNYCKKAVETTDQIKFLVKDYGCVSKAGSRSALGAVRATSTSVNPADRWNDYLKQWRK